MIDCQVNYGGTLSQWSCVDIAPAVRAPVFRRQRYEDFDIGVMPGERATAEVLQNEVNRKRLAVILQRYEKGADITSASRDAALLFLESLPRTAQLPKVAPDGDGSLLMVFSLPAGRVLVTIDNWSVHWVSRAGTPFAEYHNDVDFAGEIPVNLLHTIVG